MVKIHTLDSLKKIIPPPSNHQHVLMLDSNTKVYGLIFITLKFLYQYILMENQKKKGSNVIENHFKTSKNEEKFLLLMRDLNRLIQVNSDLILFLLIIIISSRIYKYIQLKRKKQNEKYGEGF